LFVACICISNTTYLSAMVIIENLVSWHCHVSCYFCGAETDCRKHRNKVTAEKTTYTVYVDTL
jgi:hypothetical protein